MTERTIEIKDVGPIEHLTIPIPEGGGVVVVRGRNGSGKSHALRGAQALLGGKDKPATRRGTLGATVEGLGARLTLTRRANRAGEVEVARLEGEDPSLLVDPGVKDPGAADAQRVQALLRLSGAEVDVEAFAALVGGREHLDGLCKPSSLDRERLDVPAMAAAIKRDLEAAARKEESAAENAKAKADGVRETLEGLGASKDPPEGESAQAAREAHTAAVRAHSALESRREDGEAALKAAEEARALLESLGDGGTPAAVTGAEERLRTAEDEVTRLRRELTIAEGLVEASQTALYQERKSATNRAGLERTVAAVDEIKAVEDAELAEAAQAVTDTLATVEAWAMHEKTERMRDEVAEHAQRARVHEDEGRALREAARGTEGVVLAAVRKVCGDDLVLHEGRLCVRTGKPGLPDGLEPFAELSPGERWGRALDIAVAAVGREGLLVVRQEAYEAMDTAHRRELAEHAKRLGVVILTAAWDMAEELHAEVESFAEVPASAE